MNSSKKLFQLCLAGLSLVLFSHCSLFQRQQEADISDPRQTEAAAQAKPSPEEIESANQTLLAKVEELENKLRIAEDASLSNSKAKAAAESASAPLASNENIQDLYKKSMNYLTAEKNAEAIFSLSELLEKAPRHSLAGPAQYWLGVAYKNKGEANSCALAMAEFEKAVTKYPRNPFYAESLAGTVECGRKIGRNELAADALRTLKTYFPHSPALAKVSRSTESGAQE